MVDHYLYDTRPIAPQTLITCEAGATVSPYTWNVPATLDSGANYNIQASDGTQEKASPWFPLSNASSVSTSIVVTTTGKPTETSTVVLSTTVASRTSSTSTADNLTSTPSSPIPTVVASHPSLSRGAKAGIGIGATFGILLFVGLLGVFFYFGKRAATRNFLSRTTVFEKAELAADGVMEKRTDAELDGRPVYELEGQDKRQTEPHVVELEVGER